MKRMYLGKDNITGESIILEIHKNKTLLQYRRPRETFPHKVFVVTENPLTDINPKLPLA